MSVNSNPIMFNNEFGHLVQENNSLEVFLKAHFYICTKTLTLIWYNSTRAKKAANFLRFRNLENLRSYIDRVKTNLQSSEDLRLKRKAESAALTRNAVIGDIFVSKWGWEQTNVDYFQVVGFKGKKSYILRKIGKEHYYAEGNSHMSSNVSPILNDFENDKEYCGRLWAENRIKIGNHYASLKSYSTNEKGERVYSLDYCSWYA